MNSVKKYKTEMIEKGGEKGEEGEKGSGWRGRRGEEGRIGRREGERKNGVRGSMYNFMLGATDRSVSLGNGHFIFLVDRSKRRQILLLSCS